MSLCAIICLGSCLLRYYCRVTVRSNQVDVRAGSYLVGLQLFGLVLIWLLSRHLYSIIESYLNAQYQLKRRLKIVFQIDSIMTQTLETKLTQRLRFGLSKVIFFYF